MKRNERDAETLVDYQLKEQGWNDDVTDTSRDVYKQSPKLSIEKNKLGRKRPDYILYGSDDKALAIIEVKKPGYNLAKALLQGKEYAQKIDVNIVFATDGYSWETLHLSDGDVLMLDHIPVDRLLSKKILDEFSNKSNLTTNIRKKLGTETEFIDILSKIENKLRQEGLKKGDERFTEFSKLLFLRLITGGETSSWKNF